ncbi:MAG: ATPase domain-containing protein, partial [Methylophilaceae bacterium]|nr:ATPase domain-containing protein [Methylophilaceae bacterium]
MAKIKSVYVCTECGTSEPKWQGQCPACMAWNTLVESIAETANTNRYANKFESLAATGQLQKLSTVQAADVARQPTGITEFDRVLGGGLVEGGVILIGGDPGIGKSTLLLQVLCHLGKSSQAIYVSGEESPQQIAMRAKRLGLDASELDLLAEINLEKILATLQSNQPNIAVIDSIQTVYSEALQS